DEEAEGAEEGEGQGKALTSAAVTRVAVISDTHLPRGARRLPESCLDRLRAADAILHAGDIASVAAFEELRALGPAVHAVVGNVDEPALQLLLPEERVVELGGARIGMVHVGGAYELLLRRFPGCAA